MLRRLRAALFPNSSRLYLADFLRAAAAEAAHTGARVLDVGAGDCRYKELFAGARYEATDFCKVDKPYAYGDLDVVADLVALPLAPAAYDLLVCTQVMEHLADPAAALRQGELAGIAVRLRINAQGEVTDAQTAARIGDESFARSVEQAAREWRATAREDSPAHCRMEMTVIVSVSFQIDS